MATKAFYSVSVFCIYVRATEVEAANMTKMVFEDQRDRSANPWVRTQHLKKSRIAYTYRISHRDRSVRRADRQTRQIVRQAGRQQAAANRRSAETKPSRSERSSSRTRYQDSAIVSRGVERCVAHQVAPRGLARFYVCCLFAHK